MVIRCSACESRFRLDRSLIQGYRGARIRCRRCGHPIFVTIPIGATASRTLPSPGVAAVPARSSDAAPAPPNLRGERLLRAMRPIPPVAIPLAHAEEAVAAETPPDNLVDLLPFRESYRARWISGVLDISGRISPEIPVAETVPAETAREAQGPMDFSPPPSPEGSPGGGCPLTLEEGFLWRESPPRERSVVFSAIKVTLLFTLAGTAAVYLGFHLFLALVSWAIG